MEPLRNFGRSVCMVAFLLLIGIAVLGCAQTPEQPPTEAPATPTPSTVIETEEALPSPEPSTTPMPTPTPRPTNTPFPAAVTADYQFVDRDGVITIAEVMMPVDGWLVIYPDRRGPLITEDALGFTPVDAGRQVDITVEINAQWPEQMVQIGLHGGRTAEDDGLLTATADNLLLIETLAIDTLATVPEIEAADQEILENGVVEIERVSIDEPGWLAVYPAADDDLAQLLGYTYLPAGDSEQIRLPIRWREAPNDLKAVVLQDLGKARTFEPEIDRPFKILENDLQADFSVVMPPDIVVFHQPVVDDHFVIERAATPVDGWLVIYEDGDEDGQPGFIIGSAAVKQGVNEQVKIEVNATAVVDQLLITFHEDSGELGVFDFPGSDPPQRYLQQAFFTQFRTDQGSTVMSRNQTLVEEAVVVPLVIADLPGWVAIVDDEDGQPGEMVLGATWVAAGVHHDVVVELEEPPAGSLVHAVLYSDNTPLQTFDPGESDFPLQFSRRTIAAQFEILP